MTLAWPPCARDWPKRSPPDFARFRLFFVIDQHSAAEVAKLTMDSEHVGKKLGVEFLVQGSITRRPTRLRIAASLIRAATRELLWSNSYDVSDANAPEVPEQIASALINTLHGRVEFRTDRRGATKAITGSI